MPPTNNSSRKIAFNQRNHIEQRCTCGCPVVVRSGAGIKVNGPSTLLTKDADGTLSYYNHCPRCQSRYKVDPRHLPQ